MQNLNFDQIKRQQWQAANTAQRNCVEYTVIAFLDAFLIAYDSITGKVSSH